MWQPKFRVYPVDLYIYYAKSIVTSLLLSLVLIGSNLIAVTPNASAQVNVTPVFSMMQSKNYVHDESTCIGSNRGSDYNRIYNNTVSDCGVGVDLADTSNNILNDNIIKNVDSGIVIKNVTNKIEKNRITNADTGIVFIDDPQLRYRNSTEAEYVPVASNNYKNSLASIAENNLISNAANLTKIKTLPTNDTTMFRQIDKQNVKSID